MKRFLLRIWRELPYWLQVILSRIIRPLFQVGVTAVIFDSENRILLGKSTYQRFHPWGMPGGGLEYGENAEEAVVREVFEETNLVVKLEKLLLIKTFVPDKFILYYLCTVQDGVFQPSDEVAEAAYFSLDQLPDIRPRDYAVLKEIFELMKFHKHELA
jgi:ADP-ribose pyrophosphatase YjhB (NUDIX family)